MPFLHLFPDDRIKRFVLKKNESIFALNDKIDNENKENLELHFSGLVLSRFLLFLNIYSLMWANKISIFNSFFLLKSTIHSSLKFFL